MVWVDSPYPVEPIEPTLAVVKRISKVSTALNNPSKTKWRLLTNIFYCRLLRLQLRGSYRSLNARTRGNLLLQHNVQPTLLTPNKTYERPTPVSPHLKQGTYIHMHLVSSPNATCNERNASISAPTREANTSTAPCPTSTHNHQPVSVATAVRMSRVKYATTVIPSMVKAHTHRGSRFYTLERPLRFVLAEYPVRNQRG